MIRRQSMQQTISVEKPQNGSGVLTMRKILNGPEELDQKGRAFNHCFWNRALDLDTTSMRALRKPCTSSRAKAGTLMKTVWKPPFSLGM